MPIDLKTFERQLTKEIMENPSGNRERAHALVKKFLLSEAVRLSGGKAARDEQDVTDIIRLYAKVLFLQKMVEKPETVTTRKLEEVLLGPKRDDGVGRGFAEAFKGLSGEMQRIAIQAASGEPFEVVSSAEEETE